VSSREIWASDFSLSNDLLEGKWMREIFSQYFREKKMATSDQSSLLGHFDALMALSGGAGFCMSEEGDLLSQWRAYADNGAGVSIGFNKDYFEALGILKYDRNDEFNASLTKVEYDVVRQRDYIAEHAEK
jgi:hypothetical protein